MASQLFRVNKSAELDRAGPTGLIQLLPAPGAHELYLPKWILEVIVRGIVGGELTHLSGPTGSAKSSLIEALDRVPENFLALCRSVGVAPKPLRTYPIEMAVFEAPGELYRLRAIHNGTTGFEPSLLVQALRAAVRDKATSYPLIWLREIGRVQTAAVQGGLLNLMCRSEIVLPDGERLDTTRIAWIADSNYQAQQDATHTLVVLDDALRRRFTLNVTLDYLTPEQEAEVLRKLHPDAREDLTRGVVKLGRLLRHYRAQGELQSLAPPSLYSYAAALRLAQAMPNLGYLQLMTATLLGNAGAEDAKQSLAAFKEVFQMETPTADDAEMGGQMF
jgi:MoxR-like ATPase